MEFTSDIFLPYLPPPCPLSCCNYMTPQPSMKSNNSRNPYRFSMPANSLSSLPNHNQYQPPLPPPPPPSHQLHLPYKRSHSNFQIIAINNQNKQSISMPKLSSRPTSLNYTSFGKMSHPEFDQFSDSNVNVCNKRAYYYSQLHNIIHNNNSTFTENDSSDVDQPPEVTKSNRNSFITTTKIYPNNNNNNINNNNNNINNNLCAEHDNKHENDFGFIDNWDDIFCLFLPFEGNWPNF